uniref:Ubiquitin-like domain-containing protein n=1 Tax=Tetradesmus obliquus TaxID=3088 RepID=A0A383WB89_TETOB|eukprot:jgi/Sobl393_1/6677/SZX74472.1
MDRFTFRFCSVYYGAGDRLQKTEEFALGGEKLSKLKQRACASLCLDPEAVELWRYDRAADTTGAEPLQDDMRLTDAAVQRLTTLLLQHKPLRLKVLCPDITSSVLRVELEETDTVRTLKAKACAAVGVQPSSVLLWDAYDADDLQPLEQQLGSSLADANIVQEQALLLELRKPRRRSGRSSSSSQSAA